MDAERPPDNQRRRKLLIAATSATGGVGMIASAVPFVASMLPSERAKAVGAPVEADLTGIERGTLATVEWRGQPVWILARTPQMLERLRQGEERLLDPQSRRPQQPECCRSAQRSIKPEYFIAVAICTHLGCVPTFLPQAGAAAAGPDWRGGFYCPCHGSKFDLAGRVFRGVPAPSNLVIPPHKYLTDTRVLIGEDTP